jgi:hypothetical protein
MITIKITLEFLPRTKRLLYDADVTSDRNPPDGRESKAVAILIPKLKEAFFEIGKLAGDQTPMIFEGEGEQAVAIGQTLRNARVREEGAA